MNIPREQITNVAYSYIGKKEIKGNLGFQDKEFQELMEECGWQKKQAWCAYFAELVWKQAYAPFKDNEYILTELDKTFSAGAVATFNNFRRHPSFEISNYPEPGDVVIWQTHKSKNGKLTPHWSGHAGIVSMVMKDTFYAIEGNTNSSGGREGIEVAEKLRYISFAKKKGLVLKGFIKPIEI